MKLDGTATKIAGSEILGQKVKALIANVDNVLVAQSHSVRLAIIALLAGGHVIVEDVPGVEKHCLLKA